MLQVSANLNQFGNPVIFGSNSNPSNNVSSPFNNFIICELDATNVAIYISPESNKVVDSVATNIANSSVYGYIYSLIGLSTTFNNTTNRFEITGNISNLPFQSNYSDWFGQFTGILTIVYIDESLENYSVGITINQSFFSVEQKKCSSCINLTYIDEDYDIYNPLDNYGFSLLGDVTYQYKIDNNDWVTMGVSEMSNSSSMVYYPFYAYGTARLQYCFCDVVQNLQLRAIRTVKDPTNCNNEIIYQSISTQFYFITAGNLGTTINLYPYKPEVIFEEPFKCCVSVNDEIHVDILSIAPKPVPSLPTSIRCMEAATLTYNLYQYVDGELVIIPSGSGITFTNPTIANGYDFTQQLQKGSYKLTAELCNCCTCITKEWSINICDSYVLTTGDCNNPKINNISANYYVKFTIKTYNSSNIVDSISQQIILKDVLISPLSEYEIPKLNDGFYQIIFEVFDEYGVKVGNTSTQVLFYDCNIKSCEVELRRKLLGFNWCADCDEKKAQQKEYDDLKIANSKFEIYKSVIYSYWNDIKMQQSVPETWDIEDHLQELMTYSQTFSEMNKLCENCTDSSFSGNVVSSSNSDCGCNS